MSTQKQGEGVSLEAQKDAITAFASQHDLTVTQWFEEKETTAKSGRPVFNQMLKQLKRGAASGLIMHKIDRSARNLRDWAMIHDLFDTGIDVHFATETLDFRSRGGRLTPIATVGVPAYVGFRLWCDSPARAERIARAETETLYNHALSGQVTFSQVEVDTALSRHWPSAVPDVLKIQLLRQGEALFDREGLSPEIPPPPALCNTLEGGRYRDQLARLGQVRHDRSMALEALDTISRSLAPVAQAAPPLDGEVLVEVTQFLQPLGPSVEAVVAPFFEDTPYQLFRSLRDQLDANLQATSRSGNPTFPSDYKSQDILHTYLKGTPLLDLCSLRTPFSIPDERRFGHLHMVAGSGHGKTQTLQYLIAQDLPHIATGGRSAAVIYSQPTVISR